MGREDGEMRSKDGREWRIGSAEEVLWIDKTPRGKSVADAVPPIFEAYATLEQPLTGDRRTRWESAHPDKNRLVLDAWERHEAGVLAILTAQTAKQAWWLGYLDKGSSDVVFPDAPVVQLYAGWDYVLVEAGPTQAENWRADQFRDSLPDLMFPVDRSWLATTLWDDDWMCIGGPRTLVDAVLGDPVLTERAREIDSSMSMDEACPPGHEYF